jgi:cytoskeleton protein RodZ
MSAEPRPAPPEVALGSVLSTRRAERGLTLEQAAAATRIRAVHLAALEADDYDRLPALVFARGYVRTYARYLGLDPEALVALVPAAPQDPRRTLSVGRVTGRPRYVLTTPALAAAGLLLLATAFTLYAWRQIDSANPSGAVSATPTPLYAATAPSTPIASPSAQPKPIIVGIRVTETVWINVVVDGAPQFTDAGKMLSPGSQVYFTGLDITVTSGKAAATFVTIDNRPIGALGYGVVTREFKAQPA